jgi:integrase
VTKNGKQLGVDLLNDKHIVCLAKRAAFAGGVRGDLSESDRRRKFTGHSRRAGLATSANADEYQVQQQLGHASVTMTRRYQRKRGRFRLNLTKAAGL